jgi:very-short-patch-repair endonuclease
VNLLPCICRGAWQPEADGGVCLSVGKAREFRNSMTPPERRLWNVLKQRPDGFKFRRQHEHGPYYLDFFCYEASVAVEVDGLAHELGSNPQRDQRRDAWLASRGIQTVRVRATDVRDNLEGVVAYIIAACRVRSAR